MNTFAPFSTNPNCFIVKNIGTNPQKTIFIFNEPINFGCQRDLMKTEGIGPDDIKSSLLKGTLRNKILNGEITILCSDIDLLQFNSEQKAFLEAAGIVNGLQITNNNLAVIRKEDVQLNGIVDGSNTVFKIPYSVFIQNQTYKIIVYLNGVKQVYLDDYFIAESNGIGTGYDTVIFSVAPESSILPIDIITADYYINNY